MRQRRDEEGASWQPGGVRASSPGGKEAMLWAVWCQPGDRVVLIQQADLHALDAAPATVPARVKALCTIRACRGEALQAAEDKRARGRRKETASTQRTRRRDLRAQRGEGGGARGLRTGS